jgi:hypothetical protein
VRTAFVVYVFVVLTAVCILSRVVLDPTLEYEMDVLFRSIGKCCSEASVTDYQPVRRNISEGRRPKLHGGGSMKSCMGRLVFRMNMMHPCSG